MVSTSRMSARLSGCSPRCCHWGQVPLSTGCPDPPLELLRRELESRAFEPGAVARLIDAFEQQSPLVEALDTRRRSDAAR
jgi:hypothetical protein